MEIEIPTENNYTYQIFVQKVYRFFLIIIQNMTGLSLLYNMNNYLLYLFILQ